jgi:hypothetical protein
MRQVFMSMRKITLYREDMTLNANFELGDLGACRRR